MVVITQNSSSKNQSKFSNIEKKMLEDKEDELGTENLVKVYAIVHFIDCVRLALVFARIRVLC
jgi:hypothetical protein